MKWALRVDQGVHKGKIIPIRRSPFVIGRDEDCQLRAANQFVSHRHCAFLIHGDKIRLRDFSSTNGTLLNEQRVEGVVELRLGDWIKIGPLAFVVCDVGNRSTNEQPQSPAAEGVNGSDEEDDAAAILLAADDNSNGWGDGMRITNLEVPRSSHRKKRMLIDPEEMAPDLFL
jgi:pSer/pThr/pTyr-binding forkhead associated (FHA) protein